MVKKSFTLSEARSALPLVRRIVSDILEVSQRIEALATSKNAGSQAPLLGSLEEKLAELNEELASIGCSYKGRGSSAPPGKPVQAAQSIYALVDFPGKLEGRDVMWCWRSDEATIWHYHTAEDGYVGRMPIPREAL